MLGLKHVNTSISSAQEKQDPVIKPQHKAPNERWARKIIYKDVIRRNNAIPEAGTTIQQSRSQYDPNLDENLLNKLNKKLDLNQGVKWSLRFR